MAQTPTITRKTQLMYRQENIVPSWTDGGGHTWSWVHSPRAHGGQPADQKLKFCRDDMLRGRAEAQGKAGWARAMPPRAAGPCISISCPFVSQEGLVKFIVSGRAILMGKRGQSLHSPDEPK